MVPLRQQVHRDSGGGNARQIAYQPADGGGVWSTVQEALDALRAGIGSFETRAAASAALTASPRLVFVEADESKGGAPTLYFWTGTAFLWIAAVEDEG